MELIVVEPFGLDGRIYARGEPITDAAVIEQVGERFPSHVVVRAVHDGAPSLAPEDKAEGKAEREG